MALDTWESQTVTRGDDAMRVTAVPGKHAPQPLEALLPPVMGSMLEFERGGRATFRLYITGDTLLHERLEEIPRRYPDIDLALLHLGGTRVLGVMVTMDAKQGVRALEIVGSRVAMPVHYDDYTVFQGPPVGVQGRRRGPADHRPLRRSRRDLSVRPQSGSSPARLTTARAPGRSLESSKGYR